jgi:hypothetical protein
VLSEWVPSHLGNISFTSHKITVLRVTILPVPQYLDQLSDYQRLDKNSAICLNIPTLFLNISRI